MKSKAIFYVKSSDEDLIFLGQASVGIKNDLHKKTGKKLSIKTQVKGLKVKKVILNFSRKSLKKRRTKVK